MRYFFNILFFLNINIFFMLHTKVSFQMFYEGCLINIDMVLSQLTFPCHLFKDNNRNIESEQWKNQNDVINLILVFLLLTLNIFHTFSNVSIVNFEQVHLNWEQHHRAVKCSLGYVIAGIKVLKKSKHI